MGKDDQFIIERRESPDVITLGQPDEREVWWHERYQKLTDHGYKLRPRYSPEWTPSWVSSSHMNEGDCEDAERMIPYGQVMDATRLSNGKMVALKRMIPVEHSYGAGVAFYFPLEALLSNPENHCVPIYEVFALDDKDVIIVILLLRPYDNPRFDTIGEVVECFRQLFEGLQFMHKYRVAHWDCLSRNFMLDPADLYPASFHPVAIEFSKDYTSNAKYFTRTQRPPKYYFINFGLSRCYDLSKRKPKLPICGGDKAVSEFQNYNDPCDPFATDVFHVGKAIRMDFTVEKRGLEFMKPLIAAMIQEDPEKRPKMDEVVAQFDDIQRGLSRRKLRSRVVDVDDNLFGHWRRQFGSISRRILAIPRLSS